MIFCNLQINKLRNFKFGHDPNRMTIRKAIAFIVKEYIEASNFCKEDFDMVQLLTIVNIYIRKYENEPIDQELYSMIADEVFDKMDNSNYG